MSGSNSKPTIKDVARLAGVAIGTVSRHLNGAPIRGTNRAAIERAINELDYQRNSFAAAMKSDRSGMVAFLVPAFDEFHSTLMQHLMTQFRERGLTMLIYYQDGESSRSLEQAVRYFRSHQVDALITTGSLPADDQFQALQRDGVPIVVYENRIEGLVADTVLTDDAAAVRRAVGHLVEMGHRRIAIVAGDGRHTTGQQRLAGYLDALDDVGIGRDERLIVGGTWSQAAGFQGVQSLMELPQPPTAVLFSNYVLAQGGLRFMRDRGLRIPDDLSVISIYDVDLLQLYQPPITAIVQPVVEFASNIVELVTRRLQSGQAQPVQTVNLPCELVLRASVKRLPSR